MGQYGQPYIDIAPGTGNACRSEHASPPHFFPFNAGEVQGSALSCFTYIRLPVVHLDPSHSARSALRIKIQAVSFSDPAAQQSPCHHRAESWHRKHPVHRQPCRSPLVPPRQLFRHLCDLLLQRPDPLSVCCRDTDQRSVLQHAPFHLLPDLLFHHILPLRIRKIAFIQDDDKMFDAQECQDIDMLPGLGHDSLICRNDEKHHIHAGYSCRHIVDKPLMSRHVYDPGTPAIRKLKPGKSQIDGDPSPFFLFQTVCVSSGQCFDQCGFPVIDMPRSPDGHMPHCSLSFLGISSFCRISFF